MLRYLTSPPLLPFLYSRVYTQRVKKIYIKKYNLSLLVFLLLVCMYIYKLGTIAR